MPKQSHSKTSTTVKRSSDGGVNNLAMTPQDSIINLQQTIGNQGLQRILVLCRWTEVSQKIQMSRYLPLPIPSWRCPVLLPQRPQSQLRMAPSTHGRVAGVNERVKMTASALATWAADKGTITPISKRKNNTNSLQTTCAV
jgi:hypothetical protein